jgi:phage terminase large subunit-like protein
MSLSKLPKTLEGMSVREKMQLLEMLKEREKRHNYSGIQKLYVPGTPYSIENLPKHKAYFDAGKDYRVRLIIGGNRCLAEGTLVATPSGPVPIECIKVGDYVLDERDNPVKVLTLWDNGEREVYDYYAYDGTNDGDELVVTCTPDHKVCVWFQDGSIRKIPIGEHVKTSEITPNLVERWVTLPGGIRACSLTRIFKEDNPRTVKTYDIEVDSEEHLFQLASGLVVSNSGKSQTTSYECAVQATGLYPSWWEGRRYDRPVNLWMVGDTHETVKNILQAKLLGLPGAHGTGMLPKNTILKTQAKPGVSGGIGNIQVRHVSGGVSNIGLLAYQQGMEAFYGTAMDGIFLDEEPPWNVYTECLTRTASTGGFVSLSFTPLKGYTPTVTQLFKGATLLCGAEPLEGQEFLESQDKDKDNTYKEKSSRCIIQLGWDDAPWLDEKTKNELAAEYLPHEREARMKGKPCRGAGYAFPMDKSTYTYFPGEINIQKNWPTCYGLDVGWAATAAVWMAYDPNADVVYVYDEYLEGQKLPGYHAYNIKAKGENILGAIDPASHQSGQDDGKKLFNQYKAEGLKLVKAQNARRAGYMAIYQALILGKLKISTMCKGLLAELADAQVEEDGEFKSASKYHRYDAFRYAFMQVKKSPPANNGTIGGGAHDPYTVGYARF